MNDRQRFIETLLFNKPDRIPLNPGEGRESTRKRWYSEGLPEDVKDISEYAYSLAGGKLEWPLRTESILTNRGKDYASNNTSQS